VNSRRLVSLENINNNLVNVIILLISFFVFGNSYAGELRDFEQDAISKRDSNVERADNDNDCHLIWMILFSCGDQTIDFDSPVTIPESDDSGPIVYNTDVYFRADTQYQYTKTDVTSVNLDLAVAKSGFGIRTKIARYNEISPNDHLNNFQFHGLFKPQQTNQFSLALGIGFGVLRGEKNTTGISFYIPANYQINSRFSLDASGSITSLNQNPIIDTRLSIRTHYKRFSLLLSYLSLISPEESIHGPSLGLSMQLGK